MVIIPQQSQGDNMVIKPLYISIAIWICIAIGIIYVPFHLLYLHLAFSFVLFTLSALILYPKNPNN